MFYFISDLLEMLQTSRNVQTLKFYVVQLKETFPICSVANHC